MTVSVIETTKQTALGNEYIYVEMVCGKHSALVVVCRGASNYVQVVVQNAMSRAWRGMGKRFANVESAAAAYKTDAIRNMIYAACEVQAA